MSEQKPWECKVALIDDETICYTSINNNKWEKKITLDELTGELLERFNSWIGEDRFSEREDLELLGKLLYSVLFPIPSKGEDAQQHLRSQFENDYHFLKKQKNARLRVTLEIHKAAEKLSKLPWEFLFLPGDNKGGFFLAGESSELVLTRFVPSVTVDLRAKEGPLRILIIFSHPPDLPDIDSEVTRDLIKEIEALESPKHIEVRTEKNPTHPKLCELMKRDEVRSDAGKEPKERARFQPDIIHFIGHGEPRNLFLMRTKKDIEEEEDESGRRAETFFRCDSETVLELFKEHTPRLVFLHACDSAKTVAGFSDLARDLVYAKVPVVVAMQYTIKNRDAALFAKRFYEEIRKGGRIDEAVQAGRAILGLREGTKKPWSDRRFGTPVVYLQADSDEALIKRGDEPEPELGGKPSGATRPGYDPNTKVPCPNSRCLGNLPLDYKVCTECNEPVMLCPGCEKLGQYFLISANLQKCGRCGYFVAKAIPTAESSAGEAVQSQKGAAQPEDDASRPTQLSPAGATAAVQSQKDAAQREDEAPRPTQLSPAGATTAVQSQEDTAQIEDDASRPTQLFPAGASPALASLANLQPDETKGG